MLPFPVTENIADAKFLIGSNRPTPAHRVMSANVRFGDFLQRGSTFEAWEVPVLPLNYNRETVKVHGLYWGTQCGVTISR
jgi:hypothetical protein